LYTSAPVSDTFLDYVDLLLPRLTAEIERLSAPSATRSYTLVHAGESRRPAEISRVIEAAFGWQPTSLRVRLKDRDADSLANELIGAADSPVGLADVLIVGERDEVVVISPRRDELRASFAAWARSRDSHRVLAVHISDTSGERLSA
jgi:hypothetical protein